MNNPLRKFILRKVEFHRFRLLLEESQIDLTNQCLLDIACGSGYSSRLLKNTFHPSQLTAFDLMPEQVKLAKREPIDHLFVGDLLDLDLPTGEFDGAFGFGILHHVLDWRKAAAEIARVLKPGGVLLIEEPNGMAGAFFRSMIRFAIPKEGQFTFAELELEMEKLGLELLGKKTIWAAPFQAYLWRKRNPLIAKGRGGGGPDLPRLYPPAQQR